MSDEINVVASIRCANGNFELPRVGASGFKSDQTTVGRGGPASVTATTAAAGIEIDVSTMTAPGICRLTNIEADGGATILLGWHDGASYVQTDELKPGESTVFRFSLGGSVTRRCRVASGTADLDVVVLED